MNRISAAWDTFRNFNSPFQKWGNQYFTRMGFSFGQNNLQTLITDGYKSNTQVYSIINRIAEAGADIPLTIEAVQPDGSIVLVHPQMENFSKYQDFYNFVHRPNPDNNHRSFMYASLVYQLTTGNVVQLGIMPSSFEGTDLGGVYEERYNLQPQYIRPTVKHRVTGPIVTEYDYSPNGGNWTLDPEKVMHLRKFNPDPNGTNDFMGMSPLEAAFRTMVASNENITAQASIINNKGINGLLTSRSQRALTGPEKDMMDDALHGRQKGSHNYGGVKVTSGNFDFIKMSMSVSDLKLLEMNVISLRDLCSVYGVNSRMFNDPKGTSFNNAKEDQKTFYNNAVLPPLENQLDHDNRFYNPGWNKRDGVTYIVKPDTSGIDALQEDKAKQIEKARKQSEIVRDILKGIGTDWTEESAKNQLMFSLHISEDEAQQLIDKPVEIVTEQTPQNND